jgi:phosphoserine phosphatase
MVAGADSIDDMALLRHSGMGRVFKGDPRVQRRRFVDRGVPEGWPVNSPPERRMWHGEADTSPEA